MIPTVEINMCEDTELNEIISLFVDINLFIYESIAIENAVNPKHPGTAAENPPAII